MKSILPYKSDENMLYDLANQVKKDFKLDDEEIFDTKNKLTWDFMIEKMEPIVDRLVNLDSSRFFQLLYRIDVDERKVKEIIFGTQKEPTSWSLTVLILERELLKVITKRQFSKSLE